MSSTTYSRSAANFVLRLKYLITFGDPPFLEDVEIVVENGVVVSIKEGVKGDDGLLGIPPLADAHTHLELVPLRGIVKGSPFAKWVLSLVERRELLDFSSMARGFREGIYSRFREGVFYVGEISSFGADLDVSVDLPVKVRFFVEFIGGFDSGKVPSERDAGVSPHAIYSSRESVLRDVSRYSRERSIPFTIHLFETEDEHGLFRGDETLMERLVYRRFGIKRDFSSFGSPIDYLRNCGVFEAYNPSFVHLVYVDEEVLGEIDRCGGFVVLCPSSNLYIENKLPPVCDIVGILGPDRVGLGTDSPASGVFQSVWDEMRLLMLLSRLDPRVILEMAVVGGRRALGYGYKPLSVGDRAELVLFSAPWGLKGEDLFLYCMGLKGHDILGYTAHGKLVWLKD